MENKSEKYESIIDFLRNSKNLHKETIYSEIVNLLYFNFPKMDWVGFYEKDENLDELYLSNYVGELACEKINVNNGVCGKCYREKEIQLVKDVHSTPYHIACSSSTQSEIVVPILNKNGECVSVLDIDSDCLDAFDKDDYKYLADITRFLTNI